MAKSETEKKLNKRMIENDEDKVIRYVKIFPGILYINTHAGKPVIASLKKTIRKIGLDKLYDLSTLERVETGPTEHGYEVRYKKSDI